MTYEPLDLRGKVPKQKKVDAIIVHNSGSNNDTVESVVDYHRKKWSDVGYNWMIANGTIYVGRSTMFVGAHTRGNNDGSVGVCAIGNYMSKLPKKKDIEALVRILSIECFARGLSSDKIIGHRESPGASTDCPGNKLFEYLPEIRKMVDERLKERKNASKEKAKGK